MGLEAFTALAQVVVLFHLQREEKHGQVILPLRFCGPFSGRREEIQNKAFRGFNAGLSHQTSTKRKANAVVV